uniref:Uncharacterized protein n=1 Tax=Octopus bimaculoides TaxID=37653 RepID=A0A0L8FLM0_OCTBM
MINCQHLCTTNISHLNNEFMSYLADVMLFNQTFCFTSVYLSRYYPPKKVTS